MRQTLNRILDDDNNVTVNDVCYILDDDNNVEAETFAGYVIWQMNNQHRRVVKREQISAGLLSTVFLGINLGLFGSSPLVFETALITDQTDILDRYSTYKDAVAGHETHKQKLGA